MEFSVSIFIDAIILWLYYPSAGNRKLLGRILEKYDTDSKSGAIYADAEQFKFYSEILRHVIASNITIDQTGELTKLLLKFKASPLISKEPDIYSHLDKIFTRKIEFDAVNLSLIRNELVDQIRQITLSKSVKRMYAELNAGAMTTNPEVRHEHLRNAVLLCSEAVEQDRLQKEIDEDAPGFKRVTRVDFSDRESMRAGLEVKLQKHSKNVLKTGLQGLNESLGPSKGFGVGNTVVFNALPHNYKSFLLISIARWVVTLNKIESSIQNPTCLLISLENETDENQYIMYEMLYINLFKQRPPPGASTDDILDILQSVTKAQGWKLIMERRLPTEFGYDEFVQLFRELQRDGYTPVVCIIDYMNKMKKGNGSGEYDHRHLAALYSNIGNFTKSENCTMFTAHALNREAEKIARSGTTNIVSKLNTSHLADGIDPQREVDIAYYMHIEKNLHGDFFLTLRKDKHRYLVPPVPSSVSTFGYQFDPVLGILDDIDGPSMSVNNIYSVPPFGTKKGAISEQEMPTADNVF